MDLKKYLKNLFNKDIILQKTDLGLTNSIYKFNFKNQDYILSVPNPEIKNIIRGEYYHKILSITNQLDIDVEEFFYDQKTGIRITKYVESLNFKNYQENDKYEKVIKVLKKLHDEKIKTGINFNIIDQYKQFISKIEKPLINYQKYQNIFNELKYINNDKILCHNDLVEGNILFAKNKTYLIDFEYAKDNDPLFDLMSLITENKINDEKIREIIYLHYFGKEINLKTRKELLIYENIHNLLWSSWANMMYDVKKEKIYLDIFNDKIEMLERSYLKYEMGIYNK